MIDVIVLNIETSSGDLQDGCDSNLANPHLVNDLKLHAGPEDGADTLPDLVVEVGRQSTSAGQTFDEEVLPVCVLGLNR